MIASIRQSAAIEPAASTICQKEREAEKTGDASHNLMS
jgi:hypothetical protein